MRLIPKMLTKSEGLIVIVLGRLPLGHAHGLPVDSLIRLRCQWWTPGTHLHGHRVLWSRRKD